MGGWMVQRMGWRNKIAKMMKGPTKDNLSFGNAKHVLPILIVLEDFQGSGDEFFRGIDLLVL